VICSELVKVRVQFQSFVVVAMKLQVPLPQSEFLYFLNGNNAYVDTSLQ